MNKPLFNKKVTSLFAILLIVPFIIRSLAPALEPYPAVVLPLGIGMFNIKDSLIEMQTIKINVLSKSNTWHEIDAEELIGPIPERYFYQIYSNGMGYNKNNYKTIKTAFWDNTIIPKKSSNDNKINILNNFYKKNLHKNGFDDKTFKLVITNKIINVNKNEILKEVIIDEKNYYLY